MWASQLRSTAKDSLKEPHTTIFTWCPLVMVIKVSCNKSQGFLSKGGGIHDHFLPSLRPLEFYRLFYTSICKWSLLLLASFADEKLQESNKNHFQWYTFLLKPLINLPIWNDEASSTIVGHSVGDKKCQSYLQERLRHISWWWQQSDCPVMSLLWALGSGDKKKPKTIRPIWSMEYDSKCKKVNQMQYAFVFFTWAYVKH